jgi:hypothetical protein
MGGLLVATALTLLVVPALYALWFRVRQAEAVPLLAGDEAPTQAFDPVALAERAASSLPKVAA